MQTRVGCENSVIF